jgi:hypothetical protein
MRWIYAALLLILRQFRCQHVYPWSGRLGSLSTVFFNETAVHLFFLPLPRTRTTQASVTGQPSPLTITRSEKKGYGRKDKG